MKFSHLLLLFFTTITFSQTALFNVQTIETKLPADGNGFNKLKNYTPYFYEDENYIVTSDCHGEFGGEVSFKNKKNNTVSTGHATCPIMINKVNDTYYLTTSLYHMSGFFGFYEITDPKELTVKVSDTIYYDRVQLTGGMKILAAGMHKTILLSFKYKSRIYHIVSDHDTNDTYIAERQNAILVKTQSLMPFTTNPFNYGICVTKDGHYAASFIMQRDKGYDQGYIDVFEDKIKVYLYN